MYQKKQTTQLMPEAFITVNKNRLKQYKQDSINNKVFMNNNTEFEIEIFNPTQEKLGIIFEINGKKISNNHLIIKPGQRIYLDRHIEEKSKLLYSTYTIENIEDLNIVKNAILNNGKIVIYFYKENNLSNYNLNYYTNDYYTNSDYYTNTAPLCKSNTFYDTLINSYNSRSYKRSLASEKIETGTIEKGSKSDQSFDYINVDLNYFSYYNITYLIEPLSNKPLEPKDLIRYCTNCGTKSKKNDNYCSKCGTKL